MINLGKIHCVWHSIRLNNLIAGHKTNQTKNLVLITNPQADISEVESTTGSTQQEQALASIAAMFPTVDESHIKELLKK